MPELPEVETIKNELAPSVIGRRISAITLLWEKVVREPEVSKFRHHLIGQEIKDIGRRGKYLILSLDKTFLVIHLKMTGSLLIRPSNEVDKYTRAIIHLDSGKAIHFRDPRKFGAMWLVDDLSLLEEKLGPEPLEERFTPELLSERLLKHRAPIKAVLTDQSVIAGLGNMYADEALYAARIHPLRAASSLSLDEIRRLYKSIRQVLLAAIENKGASVNTYYRPGGEKGTAHFQFKVAHQGGKDCPTCGGKIERIKVRERGTYFCPSCQTL